MSPQERELIFALLDKRTDTRMTVTLYQMSNHRRRSEIFTWLVRNNLRGQDLLDWIEQVHGGSILNAVASVVKALDRDVVKRPIIAGRDWL